jgi:hypothetical protein
MAYSTSPIVGLDLDGLLNSNEGKQIGPGVTVFGSNGKRYLSMTAGAQIASASGNGTQLAAPTQTLTAATGTGGWYSIPGVVVPAGAVFFAREGTIA